MGETFFLNKTKTCQFETNNLDLFDLSIPFGKLCRNVRSRTWQRQQKRYESEKVGPKSPVISRSGRLTPLICVK